MKRFLMTMTAMVMTVYTMAMSYEQAREQAYYLTDKMAYELNLNDQQYNDAYEINLDYLLSLRTADDAIGSYLTYRNADLRYILHDWQWSMFCAADYFMRPVSWIGGAWYFPIYRHYAHSFWYYNRPSIFWDYRGAHCHTHYVHTSYYANRRPGWDGGMRGRDRSMVGRDQSHHGGRIGTQPHNYQHGQTRGGERGSQHNMQHGDNGMRQHSYQQSGNQRNHEFQREQNTQRGGNTGMNMRSSSRNNASMHMGGNTRSGMSTGSRSSMSSGSRGSFGSSTRGSMGGSSHGSMGGTRGGGGRR